jgi:hypothetical protein
VIAMSRKLFLLTLFLIFLNSCGGAISRCQENGRAELIGTKERKPSGEEMTEITQMCVDNPKTFDSGIFHSK